MEKFTKGPWSVGNMEHDGAKYVYPIESLSSGGLVCNCYGTTASMVDWYAGANSVKFNAALIASAPEMYKFLKDIASGNGVDYPIEQLLAKARGEQ